MKKAMVHNVEFPVHTLNDGTRVVMTSKHGFTFSDVIVATAPFDVSNEYVDTLKVEREFKVVWENPRCTESTQRVSDSSLKVLDALQASEDVDIILVPFMLIGALKDMGIRNQYPKALAFNATPETARTSVVSEKIVDVNNWAW